MSHSVSQRGLFQASAFVASTIVGAAVTVLANAVMNSHAMVSSATVVGTGFLIFLFMGVMEVLLDLVMDAAGETRLIVARRFPGRPRHLIINAALTGFGIILVSYSIKVTRTPLPVQVSIQLLSNLIVPPAKVVFLRFRRPLRLFGGATQPEEVADVRAFWRDFLLASAAFTAATALTLIDRTYVSGLRSRGISWWFVGAYTIGCCLMSGAQIHADGALSEASLAAAGQHRRSTMPSVLELMRHGLSFGSNKQLWRCFACLPMILMSLAIPGLDAADIPVNMWSTTKSFVRVFSLHNGVLMLFVVVSALQAGVEPLMNAKDSSLTAASQNMQSALLLVCAWVPALTHLSAGYYPSYALTLPACALVLYGGIPLARYSEVIQRYQHGPIAAAPDEETAIILAEANRRGSSWDVSAPPEVPELPSAAIIRRTGLCATLKCQHCACRCRGNMGDLLSSSTPKRHVGLQLYRLSGELSPLVGAAAIGERKYT
jgi:hypothetical protein